MSHKNTIDSVMLRIKCGVNPSSEKCFEWQGAKNSDGYGSVGVNGKTWSVHRFVWHSFVGPIPKGLFILHRCDNPLCARLSHLFLGNNSDNVRDFLTKGQSKGAKLSYKKANEIRFLWRNGMIKSAIAKRYGVTAGAIHFVVNNVTWMKPFTAKTGDRVLCSICGSKAHSDRDCKDAI